MKFAKVMFSQVSVCPREGHAWQGWHAWPRNGGCGRGCAWEDVWQGRGVCVEEGAYIAGGHEWQERRPLQWAVRILLECILVVKLETVCQDIRNIGKDIRGYRIDPSRDPGCVCVQEAIC